MKRVLLVLTAAIALGGNGCDNSSVASNTKVAPETPANSAPSQPLPNVGGPRPSEPGDILSILTVEHQVDLSSQRDGVVTSLLKDEGNVVNTGDILGHLDDRTLQQELIKARDDLKVTENNLQYKAAELKAKGAAYRRQQQLREAGLSSQADLEQAEFEAKGAEYDMHGYEALVESGKPKSIAWKSKSIKLSCARHFRVWWSAVTFGKAKPSRRAISVFALANFLRFKSNFKFLNWPGLARSQARQ